MTEAMARNIVAFFKSNYHHLNFNLVLAEKMTKVPIDKLSTDSYSVYAVQSGNVTFLAWVDEKSNSCMYGKTVVW